MNRGIRIAVVGAHLRGQPLNYQLIEAGGAFLEETCTLPVYQLYALKGGAIPKPGLIRLADAPGVAIQVEVWSLPMAGFGQFVAQVPSPLCIGTLLLEEGQEVKGFLCEPFALQDALNISHLGGWRRYLALVEGRAPD